MKKKIILLGVIAGIGLGLYLFVKMVLIKNFENFPEANGWLNFFTIIVAVIYILIVSCLLKNDMIEKFKGKNLIEYITDKVIYLYQKVSRSKFVKAVKNMGRNINNNRIINFVKTNQIFRLIIMVFQILTVLGAFLVIIANLAFHEFIKNHGSIYIIGIFLCFATALFYFFDFISAEKGSKSKFYRGLYTINWIFIGAISIATYISNQS